MSVVTNVILSLSIDDAEERLGDVNRYFDQIGFKGLVSCDDPSLPDPWYGGNKRLEVSLFIGAFSGLDLEAFIGHLRSIRWGDPDRVQLIVKEQEDDRLRLIEPIGTT